MAVHLFVYRAGRSSHEVGPSNFGSLLRPLQTHFETSSFQTLKADSHITRRYHAAPMPFPCHAMLRQCRSSQGHSTAVERRPCCAVALRRTALSEHGMASVNQTRPHCKSSGKHTFETLSDTAWQGNGMSTACYVCESAFTALYLLNP